MRLLDENCEDGTLTYKCPECGHEEKQYERTAGSPETERDTPQTGDVNSVHREPPTPLQTRVCCHDSVTTKGSAVLHVEVERGFEVFVTDPDELHIRLSLGGVIGNILSRDLFGKGRVLDGSFVFDKKTGSISHNTKHVTTLADLEQIQIRAGADTYGKEILAETPDEGYYKRWKRFTEDREPVHLLLIYGGGQSIRVGHTIAVEQLRKAAYIVAEFTNVEIWDNGPEPLDPSEDPSLRNIFTGKYDPAAVRRIGTGDVPRMICPNPDCRYEGLPKKKARGSYLVGCAGCLFFLLPGFLYFIFMTGYRYHCAKCGMQIASDR